MQGVCFCIPVVILASKPSSWNPLGQFKKSDTCDESLMASMVSKVDNRFSFDMLMDKPTGFGVPDQTIGTSGHSSDFWHPLCAILVLFMVSWPMQISTALFGLEQMTQTENIAVMLRSEGFPALLLGDSRYQD